MTAYSGLVGEICGPITARFDLSGCLVPEIYRVTIRVVSYLALGYDLHTVAVRVPDHTFEKTVACRARLAEDTKAVFPQPPG